MLVFVGAGSKPALCMICVVLNPRASYGSRPLRLHKLGRLDFCRGGPPCPPGDFASHGWATTGGCPYGLHKLGMLVFVGADSKPAREFCVTQMGNHRGLPLQMQRYFEFIVGATHASPLPAVALSNYAATSTDIRRPFLSNIWSA